MLLSIFCVALSIVVIFLCLKIITIYKSLNGIIDSLSQKLNSDTNTLISVCSNDKMIKKLANGLNLQLKELRRLKHKFVQGDKELKNAVTNISHDLRTPLTAINGYLELLESEEKSEAAKRYLNIIKSRVCSMKDLTEELFKYSVIISTESKSNTELFDLKSLLEEAVSEHYAALTEKNIIPTIKMPENKVFINSDRSALMRIFSNLLNNAVKYSDGDLDIVLTEDKEMFFSNTAKNLTQVQVEQLFDRFYTVENARASTGLGLSISKTLVESLGGTITATLNQNTLRFHLKLNNSNQISKKT